MTRPKRTGKDRNHTPIRDELRADGFVVLDVADLPGDPEHNPLDLVVMRADADPVPVIVVTSADGVRRWFEQHPSASVVQVEVKPDLTNRYTVAERLYLRKWGLWPPEVWT